VKDFLKASGTGAEAEKPDRFREAMPPETGRH